MISCPYPSDLASVTLRVSSHKMDDSLHICSLRETLKARLLQELWAGCQPEANQAPEMAAYFEHYLARCHRFYRDGGRHICVKTHGEIISIARKILNNSSRSAIISDLINQSQSSSGALLNAD